MQADTKKRVGILRGGAGEDYFTSLKHGGDILVHIQENLGDKYKTFDILIDKDHAWHINGLPVTPSDLAGKLDVVWNTSHPSLSNLLESLSVPHVSTGHFSSALENSKEMLREHMQKLNVSLPRSIVLPVYQPDFDGPRERYAIKKAKEVFEKFGSPWIVKSFTPDRNMAIHLAKTFPELVNAIEDGLGHEKSILVEEFITGKVGSVHTLADFRNQPVYTFPLGKSFGNFTASEKEKLDALAKHIHSHIGAKHYLKADFVLNSRGKIYLLGITNTPNLKPDSHFSEVCELTGVKTHNIIDHILKKALN